ncbi:MAG: hypothetical protein KAS32_25780, partial [Candidatus Peribacteraceae bacterium]|nr:hypothetical protein [Candidatus Peribacteraceae bacterium]
VVNYIWPSHIAEIAKLTRNRHTIITDPWEPSDDEAAVAWQGVLQWQWEKGLNGRGMRLEQMQTILDQQLFGYSVTKAFWEDKVTWDEQQLAWQGDVKTRLWHPAEFWASDDEKIDDGDCGTERILELEEAIKLFPKFKKKLTEEANNFTDSPGAGTFESIRGQLASAGTYPGQGVGGQDLGTARAGTGKLLHLILKSDKLNAPQDDTKQKSDIKLVRLNETWMRDFEEKNEEIKEDIPAEELVAQGRLVPSDGIFIDTQTGDPIKAEDWPQRVIAKVQRPLYPRGRVILHAGDTVISDESYKYSRWPFVITPHYLLPHMWQGIDGVQLYRSTQDMINISVSHLFNNLKQYGDRKVAIEEGAIRVPKGKDKALYKIGKGAGSVIRLALGGLKRIKFIEPSQVPPAATQFYGLMAQEFKNIQGLQSIARGEKQPGKMTATEASFLTISANDRIQLQSIYEDQWIKETATLVAEIMQDKYEPERWVRILGEDDIMGIQQITQKLKTTKFDVDIMSGLTLPFDKEKRQQSFFAANQLVTQPVASPMTDILLKELEIPGWQKILKKYQSWQDFIRFLELNQAVLEGRITPQQGIQLLVQEATKRFQQQGQTIGSMEQQKIENEKEQAKGQSSQTAT